MIFVERSQPPAALVERGAKARDEAIAFFAKPGNENERFDFRAQIYASREVRAALTELFHDKCAFCESELSKVTSMDLEQFRPKGSVVTAEGSVLRPGYYWLAYAWDNLYPACPQCNRTKANRFPLADETLRARTPEDSLEGEDRCRLLLDPCRDDPEAHLIFRDDGIIACRWSPGESVVDGRDNFDFVNTTIAVFGLNRAPLVASRAQTMASIRHELDSVLALSHRDWDLARHELSGLLEPGWPYAACRRQVVARWLEEKGLTELGRGLKVGASALSDEKRKERFDEYEQRATARKGISVEDEGYDIFTQSSQISRIEIRNFGPIESLDFDLGPGTSDRAGWKMLLGENAVGKSSVLRALALTIMGDEHLAKLEKAGYVDTSKLLRREAHNEKNHDNRCVRIFQATEKEPLTMTLFADARPKFNHRGLKAMLLGFGSARWLPRPGSLEPESGRFVRVQNLFNPFVPLVDALQWLRELHDLTQGSDEQRKAWDDAEAVILRLLHHEGASILVSDNDVILQRTEIGQLEPVPLTEMSDGYQTVLAMAVSIMAAMMQRTGKKRGWKEMLKAALFQGESKSRGWKDMAEAEGLVLIDEIGAHLHPRWKMRIVSSLRDAFPRIQFVTTSHEPLCLRGLFDKEILVLHRTEEGEILKFDDLPSVDNLGIDKLLTSRLFGLLSTLDLETERDFQEFYELLQVPDRSREQEERLVQLRQTVGAGGPLGATRRDQMIYRIADEYLAHSPREPVTDNELSVETKERVAELWKEVLANPDQYL